jgi:hypothetical protein
MYELLYFKKSRRQRKEQARSAPVTVSPNMAP